MKRVFNIAILLMLCCLPMAAQLNGSGFYRFRNYQNNSEYISMANDLFNYHIIASNSGGGLSQLNTDAGKLRALACAGKYLQTDIHMVEDAECIDPASVIYAEKRNTNPSDNDYNLIGQGTSLLTLTTGTYAGSVSLSFKDRYVTISKVSGSGANTLYTASIELKSSTYVFLVGYPNLGIRYLVDDNSSFAINESASANNAKWYIEPVTHFNVKPEVEYGGKFYTTLYVPYAFELSGAVENAYVVTNIGTDGALELATVATKGQTVPAGTPVLLECSSDVAADCQLIPKDVPLFTEPDVNVTSQGAPRATTATNYTGTNLLKGNYYSNQDGNMSYLTNGGTGTFNANHYTARAAKLKVLGLTASGKLGMVTPPTNWTAMPANKAWLEYTGSAELVFPFTASKRGDVDRDGDVDIDDVNAAIDIVLNRDVTAKDYDFNAADVDGDNDRDIDDVNIIIDIVLGRIAN